MSRISRFLAALLVMAVIAVCVRLGFWQLDRLDQRRTQNGFVRAAQALPPLELDDASFAALASRPAEFQHRTVTARGIFLPGSEVILRGRSLNGQPGVHLLAPFKLQPTGQVVMVSRGWVPSADAATIDPLTFHVPGSQWLEGTVQLFPSAEGQGAPRRIEVNGHRVLSVGRLDAQALRGQAAPLVLSFYLQQTRAGEVVPPVVLPRPQLDDGPHLGYALQWFGIALVFATGSLVLVVRGAGSARRHSRHG